MRQPFTETITIYTLRGGKWARTVARGVMWKETLKETVSDGGQLKRAKTTLVTIPVDAIASKLTLAPGDAIVKGECTRELSEAYTLDDLTQDEQTITVVSVTDNTARRCGKTWKVTGDV